jgi:hypothetical protein
MMRVVSGLTFSRPSAISIPPKSLPTTQFPVSPFIVHRSLGYRSLQSSEACLIWRSIGDSSRVRIRPKESTSKGLTTVVPLTSAQRKCSDCSAVLRNPQSVSDSSSKPFSLAVGGGVSCWTSNGVFENIANYKWFHNLGSGGSLCGVEVVGSLADRIAFATASKPWPM